MKNLTNAMAVLGGLLLTACASQTGWTPTVDPYNDPNAYRINQDMAECQQLASQASGGTTKETLMGAGAGGLIGGAGGAALGAITGDPAKGAILGATIGGLGGAAKQGLSAEDRYKNAYNGCMANRGHRVVR